MRVTRYKSRKKISFEKKGFFARLKSLPAFMTFLGFPLLVLGLVLLFWFAVTKLPGVEDAKQLDFAQSTVIYDRGAAQEGANPSDHILYVIHGDENRNYVKMDKISERIKEATLAIEDDGFYSHWGFDLGGLAKAVLSEIGIGSKRGGSTITQQLIKNTFLNNERTWTRKFKEILLSVKMEGAYTKDEIFELYLNKIPYGNNAYGVEMAAQTYFAKNASELNLIESAVIASLPVAPTRFNPYKEDNTLLMGYEGDDGTWKKGRKDLVLDRMETLGNITAEEKAQAIEDGKTLEFKRKVEDIKAPHFVMHIKKLVSEKYGDEILETGGLNIFTTLDPELQNAAESVVAERTKDYLNGFRASNASLAAINPDNGEVLAYIGGKDYFSDDFDGQVDVMQSFRQPGSSFKPFVYAAAFEKGYAPGTVLFDVKTNFGNETEPYEPQNYDEKFEGPMSARTALNKSQNIPAIKMAHLAGGDTAIVEYAQKAGVEFADPELDHGVAIGVGSAEVRPISLISGYQVFATDGTYYEPTYILKITDEDGNDLEKDMPEDRIQVGVTKASVGLTRNILIDEKSRPQSWNKYLQIEDVDNGAKTGTTNRGEEPSDSWTIGFTPQLVSGVWVGNNSGETMVGGATGLAMAAPIWKNFNEKAHEILAERGVPKDKAYAIEFEPLALNIMKHSGKLARETTPKSLIVTEYFDPENPQTEYDSSFKTVVIDNISGKFATAKTPEYLKRRKTRLYLNSVLPDKKTWQTPVANWMARNSGFALNYGTGSVGYGFGKDQRTLDAEYAAAELEYRKSQGEVIPEKVQQIYQPKQQQYQQPGQQQGQIIYKYEPGKPVQIIYATPKPEQQIISGDEGLSIKIISPPNESAVTTSNVILRLNPRSKNGIANVVLFVNNTPVRQFTGGPWQTSINVQDQITRGLPFTVRAVVTDIRGNAAEHSIRLRPTAPKLSF